MKKDRKQSCQHTSVTLKGSSLDFSPFSSESLISFSGSFCSASFSSASSLSFFDLDLSTFFC